MVYESVEGKHLNRGDCFGLVMFSVVLRATFFLKDALAFVEKDHVEDKLAGCMRCQHDRDEDRGE